MAVRLVPAMDQDALIHGLRRLLPRLLEVKIRDAPLAVFRIVRLRGLNHDGLIMVEGIETVRAG